MNTIAQLNILSDRASVNHRSNSLQPQAHALRHQIRIVDTPGDKFANEIVAEAIEMAGLGRRVLVVQLLKGGIRQGHNQAVNLAQNLDWIRCNLLRNITKPDLDAVELQSVQQLWHYVKTTIDAREYSLAIVDGLSLAIELGLIGVDAATTFLTQLPHDVEVVLTGTNPHPAILELTCD
jgi:cob(I)alamin adenosyltransferase